MFYNTKAYRALKSPFRAKYMTLDLKKCRGVIFHETKSHAKFEEKLTCGQENDMSNLANFHQNT